jgi:hypothetical protein
MTIKMIEVRSQFHNCDFVGIFVKGTSENDKKRRNNADE